MRPLRRTVWGCALVLTAATAGPASAAWNNVFQVTCFHGRSSVSAASPISACAPACAPACPQQSCTTQYVQRSYYQPVTTYRTSHYYEPVTTYRTSYYYEPVTSYRYSCYYDPCSCSYQQVAQPVTSYRLRSQCCPVTSYLQRTYQTPVTSYQQAFYYEPVTTCCTTSVGAPVAACPQTVAPPAGNPPSVTEQRTPPPVTQPPSVQDSRDVPMVPNGNLKYPNKSNGSSNPIMPRAPDGNSYRQPQFYTPAPAAPPAQTRPAVRLERIVTLPGPNLEGQVVSSSHQPLQGAHLLFVSAVRNGTRQAVTADEAGRFRVALASGAWLVYTHDADGRPVFSRKVDVDERAAMHVTLLSR